MRMIARWVPDPSQYVGRTVKTTGNRTGVVEAVHPHPSGILILNVRGEYGDFFTTDTEHATIVREKADDAS